MRGGGNAGFEGGDGWAIDEVSGVSGGAFCDWGTGGSEGVEDGVGSGVVSKEESDS